MIGALFGFLIKLFKWTSFTVLVLLAGQLVHWRGLSLSDHIKQTLSFIETWTGPAQTIAEQTRDKMDSFSKQIEFGAKKQESEKISAAERARLRKVIHN